MLPLVIFDCCPFCVVLCCILKLVIGILVVVPIFVLISIFVHITLIFVTEMFVLGLTFL